MPEAVQSPEKELRFTRSGQAVGFWLLAAVAGCVALIIASCAVYREIDPRIPHPLWALPPLLVAGFSARLAVRMTKHAYLILTPLGVEIFPFFRPERTMQMVLWSEIHDAETDGGLSRLTLHHDAEKTSGIHISLSPIRRDRRALLAKAIAGRVSRA